MPLFCPPKLPRIQQNQWFAHILEKSGKTVIIVVCAYMKSPKPILFTLFCLINLSIPWIYRHLGDFGGKSGQKMGKSGKFSIFSDYFHPKCWQLSKNIQKSHNGNLVNHVWFKSLVSSPIWQYPALLWSMVAFWEKYCRIMGQTVIKIIGQHKYRHFFLVFFLRVS